MATPRSRSIDERMPQLRYSWLALIAIGLVLALVAAVLVQGRQFSLLRHAMQPADEHLVGEVYQAGHDYLRLREQWRRAADQRLPFDGDTLRRHYETWSQRTEVLRTQPVRDLLGDDAPYRLALDEIEQFGIGAERALGATPATRLDRTFAAALLPLLEALDAPVQGLSLAAGQRLAERAEQRAATVRQQNQLGLALTVFMAVLTLAFAGIALRHVSDLRARRRVLEDLATELRQARREAEAASEAKSAFLANMSHEIRTPFHGLMGMLSMLRETGLTARQIDYLRTATESADHLLAILNDILDMSQLETGRMTINPVPTDLRVLLRDVEALMRPQANGKQLALHIDTDPGVPERIVGDTTRVKQVLFNLLSNAIKFSDHGVVVLDVRTGNDTNGQPVLLFVVTDTGIGIDEPTRGQLFHRFVQGDSSRSRRFGGTGLGLEISRNLARMMDGDITLRSQPGEGSEFTFSMRLQLAPAVGHPRPVGPDNAEPPLRTQPLHVLVAEDHPVNRQYMAALLESLGHEAHFTANGQEAVQAVQTVGEPHFDVVLMDLHMPVLDGVGATRAIRALPDRAAATVPIVALTADALEQTRERCLVAGMNDFLTKPVSPQKLASALRRLFGSSPAGTQAAAESLPTGVAAPSHGAPMLDLAAVQGALQSMPRERLAAIIEAFLAQGPQTVQRLRAAVRDAQPLELRVNAHAATGAALNLGLSALAATASALHEGAAHLPAHEIARLVQRYEELLPLTREAVRAAGLQVQETMVTG